MAGESGDGGVPNSVSERENPRRSLVVTGKTKPPRHPEVRSSPTARCSKRWNPASTSGPGSSAQGLAFLNKAVGDHPATDHEEKAKVSFYRAALSLLSIT